MISAKELNLKSQGKLPDHLGMRITEVLDGEIRAEMEIRPFHLAPNGFLHAGSIVTLADTTAGYGSVSTLPKGATGFTTVELKSNFLGTALEGKLLAAGKLIHGGRTTQVWDVTVTHVETGKTLALFRCTQMILYSL